MGNEGVVVETELVVLGGDSLEVERALRVPEPACGLRGFELVLHPEERALSLDGMLRRSLEVRQKELGAGKHGALHCRGHVVDDAVRRIWAVRAVDELLELFLGHSVLAFHKHCIFLSVPAAWGRNW